MKKSYALFAVLSLFVCKVFAQPTTAAAPPTANKANVISLWGKSYTNVPGTDWFPGWGQSTQVAYSNIGGDTTINYSSLNYEGVKFSSPLNIVNMDSIHLDIWTSNCTSLDIRLINSAAVSGTGNPIQPNFTATLKTNTWNSVSIAISQFAGLKLGLLDQMSFTGLTPAAGGSIYSQNIYFSSHVNLPTISGFTIPSSLLVGAAPFTITAPTSNSTGAFTYSSSDSSVAIISGNIVTIVGAGTTVITANQAAAGSYSSGSASATLVVSFAPPTTAASMPNKSAANVISIWGNHYTNVSGINFRPDWGQATQISLLNAGGDTTLEYSALTYEGIQFASPIDVSKAESLHLDIWSPNCTSIILNIINSALVTGGTPVQIPYTISLTKSGWNSVEIPMSAFKGLDFSKIDQFMFVGDSPAMGGVIYLQNVYFWAAGPLAVKIDGLKASLNGNSAIVSWKSLTESGLKGYNVQHSTDAINWTSLKQVASQGNNANYSFTDNSIVAGTNYYRLGFVDAMGKTTYSTTVSVDNAKAIGVSFYPNPVKSVLNVKIASVQSATASISLVNATGKTVKSLQLSKGASNVSFDVANIAKGTYLVVLRDGNTTNTSKVIVAN